MPLDFPNSPGVGQTFPGPGGVTWTWDGVKWVGGGGSGGGGGSSSVVVSPTPPASPTVGQLWWDSTGGQLYIRYEDPNTQQWVTTHNIGFGVPLTVQSGGTGIVTYSQGDLIYGSAPDTLARLTKATAATRYLANTGASNNPAWDQVNLANGVTGILPVSSGGTGTVNLPITNVGFTPAFTTVVPFGNGTNPLIAATSTWTIMGGRFPGAELSFFTAVSGASNQINMFKAEGSLAAPTRTNANLVLGGISFGGHNGTNWTTPASSIYCMAAENWSAAGNGTRLYFSAVKVGASTPAVAMWLDGDGALSINGNDHSRLFLNKSQASSYTSAIYGQKNGVTRWSLELGGVGVESTGNLGSDFHIGRFADNGAWIDNPMAIYRATGLIHISQSMMTGGYAALTDLGQNSIIAGHVMSADFAYNAYWSSAINNWKYVGAAAATIVGLTGGNFAIHQAPTGAAGAAMTITRRFMVDPNGATFIDNAVGGEVISCATPINTDCGIKLQNGNRTWVIHNQGFSSAGQFWIYDITGAALRLVLDPAGNSFNTTGTWIALVSDARAKRDVQPYARGLAELVMLEPVMFKFNGEYGSVDDDSQQYGLIAQDVEPHVPEIVGERQWTPIGEDGMPTGEPEPVKNLDPGRLIFAMINAFKELDGRVKALEGGTA